MKSSPDIVADYGRILGNRFPHHRIIIATAFILPSLLGNLLLWKSSRENKAALFAGLYVVSKLRGFFTPSYSVQTAVSVQLWR
jgi:ACS family allantoate permease-like MFS transporter